MRSLRRRAHEKTLAAPRGISEYLNAGRLRAADSRITVTGVTLSADDEANLATRPRTRGDCRGGERPCPWLGCRHHLALEITESGSIKLAYEDLDQAPETCSLDIAERGDEQTLEAVGVALNVTRERIRQIEARATEAYYLGLRRRGFAKNDILAWIAARSERTVDWREPA
jgi:hypothetical protein